MIEPRQRLAPGATLPARARENLIELAMLIGHRHKPGAASGMNDSAPHRPSPLGLGLTTLSPICSRYSPLSSPAIGASVLVLL
jgi:hypothetical protein